MNIAICIKDRKYRAQIINAFYKTKERHGLNGSVVLNTSLPDEVLEYVSNNISIAIYFLDADLSQDAMSMFDVAKKIRERDWQCQIVFVSYNLEMCILSFKYKIQAMDCLVKSSDDFEFRIEECLLCIIERQEKYISDDLLTFCCAKDVINILRDDVIFVESVSNSHKVILHYRINRKKFNKYQLNESLKVLEQKLGNNFIRCHKSFIVNKNYIRSINKKIRTLEMSDGSTCYYSRSNTKNILQLIN